jgi:hypothetical protein
VASRPPHRHHEPGELGLEVVQLEVVAGPRLRLKQAAEVRRPPHAFRHRPDRLLGVGGEAAQDRRDQAGVLEGLVADEVAHPRSHHQRRHPHPEPFGGGTWS